MDALTAKQYSKSSDVVKQVEIIDTFLEKSCRLGLTEITFLVGGVKNYDQIEKHYLEKGFKVSGEYTLNGLLKTTIRWND